MLTWSTSATASAKPNVYRSEQSKVAEDFLQSWDNAVYDRKSIGDQELDREAALWREQFPHLRITGVNMTNWRRENKVTFPQKTLSQSKSAYTFREKTREISLPRIDKTKKS